MKIKSVDKHLKELLKDPVFKKEYLKDKKKLRMVVEALHERIYEHTSLIDKALEPSGEPRKD